MNYCQSVLFKVILLTAPFAQVSQAETESNAMELSQLLGRWHVEYVRDRPVIDRSPASIEFADDGRFTGNASCNRMAGEYKWNDGVLELGRAAVTRMACPEALMEQEQRLLAAIGAVAGARIENGLLILEDIEGKLVIKAARHN